MKRKMAYLYMVIFLGFGSYTSAETGSEMPLNYISSCEFDFNGDNNPDIALLVETSRERELIVLMSTSNGYNAFVVSRNKPNMYLSCHYGKTVKETATGNGKVEGNVYKTSGTYIQLTQPEGSSVVYFWNENEFKEVWTSD